MSREQRLAVYGTLGPGRPNHHQLAGMRGDWSEGVLHGHLHESGWGAALGYPGIVLDPHGPPVSVELFDSRICPPTGCGSTPSRALGTSACPCGCRPTPGRSTR